MGSESILLRYFVRPFLVTLAVVSALGVGYAFADTLHTFSSGDSVSSSKINANFQKLPPIGSIQAWHKSLSGVPALPDGWLECDGSTVADAASPLNGVTLPDLNSTGHFLRGSTTSGATQTDAFQGHSHIPVPNTGWIALSPGGPNFLGAGGVGVNSATIGNGAPVANGFGTPRTATETRPINTAVVWIIRIK